jgi:metal-dependent amidase/aminoacylase/carboxypeptidase family protein
MRRHRAAILAHQDASSFRRDPQDVGIFQPIESRVGCRSDVDLWSGTPQAPENASVEIGVDPVVMAAATVLRLQGIVSREVPPTEAVVTIGVLQAGTKENVIPDEAIIKLNVRTFDEGVRKLVLAAIERIVNAEAEASGAPRKPEITPLDHYSLTTNDPNATGRVRDALRAHFPADSVQETKPTMASEDFGSFGAEWRVPRSFGSSGEWIVMCTRRRRGTARSVHFRLITVHTSHRSSIQLRRQALKRWLSPRWLGWRSSRA